jgi:hypothetical protein
MSATYQSRSNWMSNSLQINNLHHKYPVEEYKQCVVELLRPL